MPGALGALQLAALPLLGVFTPIAEVQRAARVPSMLGAVLQLINGITFIGEGVMVGTVDGAQGAESDLVILSFVRANSNVPLCTGPTRTRRGDKQRTARTRRVGAHLPAP